MCVYLRTKCQVSSTILTSFRREGGLGEEQSPKKPTQISVKEVYKANLNFTQI